MAKRQSVTVDIETVLSVVKVTAESVSAGQDVGISSQTASVTLSLGVGSPSISYSLNGGASWRNVTTGGPQEIPIDLSVSSLLLRKGDGGSSNVNVNVSIDHIVPSSLLRIGPSGTPLQTQPMNIRPRASFIRQYAQMPAAAHPGNGIVVGVGQAVSSDTAPVKNYVCCVQGTTGSSTKPTGVGVVAIADGTARWFFDGIAPTAQQGVPTIVISNSNPVPATFPVLYRPSGATTGLQQTRDVTNDDWYSLAGGSVVHTIDGLQWDPDNDSTGPYEIATLFDGSKFGVAYPPNVFQGHEIYCDDQLLIPGVQCRAFDSNFTFHTYTFPDAKFDRKITLLVDLAAPWLGMMTTGDASFRGFQIDKTDSVTVVGDSYIDGSDFAWELLSDTPHYRYAKSRGFQQWRKASHGGTGYGNPGSDGDTFIQRIAKFHANQREILVLGGINDSVDGFQALVAEFIAKCRTTQPYAQIFIGGVFPGSTGPDSDIINKEMQAKAAVAACGDTMVHFIPISTAPTPCFFGTGITTDQNGSGNTDRFIGKDSDPTHPIFLGTRHMMDFIAAQTAAYS